MSELHISPKDVFQLRKDTGAGMMACKKALQEAGGDMDEAMKLIRASAKSKADKKKDRETASGCVQAFSGSAGGVVVEVKSETDFVARNELFQKFSQDLAALAYDKQLDDVEALMSEAMQNQEGTVEQVRSELVQQLGENIVISRCHFIPSESQKVSHYVHMDRIAVIVRWQGDHAEVGPNMAMQIAAADPQGLSKEDIPEKMMADECDIFKKQVDELGKPAEVANKILQGKIDKFVDSQILGGQDYICDDSKQKVRDYLKQQHAQVTAFTRFELGQKSQVFT